MITPLIDMSIHEVNGHGPKKRTKSECNCDNKNEDSNIGEQGEEFREKLEQSDGSKDREIRSSGGYCSGCSGYRVSEGDGVKLLHWRDMPAHLQFNPYILTGYRPLQTWGQCLHSLTYLHNETINILTHGVPIVCMLVWMPGSLPWGGAAASRLLALCHLLGALAPWCGSTLYHLFMNHAGGKRLYDSLLQLDMLGIWLSQSIGALPMVTATVWCSPGPVRAAALALYTLASLLGLRKAMRAWSPWERRMCFATPFTMRMVLVGARLCRLGGGDPRALVHLVLQDLLSVAGGMIGVMHIPEKWMPGTVDLIFNSHNIMHVLVIMAVYSMHQATVFDLEWLSHPECSYPLEQL